MSAPTPAELVVAAFPYDGPHTPQRVTAAAETVAVVLRYLANATCSRGAVATGPGLGAVLSHLSAAPYSLAQVLRQLDAAAERIADDPTLYDDHGADAQQTAVGVAVACGEAARVASVLDGSLNDAHQLASRLGHH